MHKTLTLALGAGLLATAALQFPDAALAAKKGSERSYGFIKPGETRGIWDPGDKNRKGFIDPGGKSRKGLGSPS